MSRDVKMELYINGKPYRKITGEYIGTGEFGLASGICLKDGPDKVRTLVTLFDDFTHLASGAVFPNGTYEIRITLGEEK